MSRTAIALLALSFSACGVKTESGQTIENGGRVRVFVMCPGDYKFKGWMTNNNGQVSIVSEDGMALNNSDRCAWLAKENAR